MTPPEGAYYLFADYRSVPSLAAMSPVEAAMHLVEKVGVATVPGDNFYATGNEGDRYLRFAFCVRWKPWKRASSVCVPSSESRPRPNVGRGRAMNASRPPAHPRRRTFFGSKGDSGMTRRTAARAQYLDLSSVPSPARSGRTIASARLLPTRQP